MSNQGWLRAYVRRLLEDDGFIFVEEDSVFDVPANGAGEDNFFEVAAFFDEVFHGIAMPQASSPLRWRYRRSTRQ